MEKEIRIESINIAIGKRELTLSIEDAKKLHSALNNLFGAKIEYRDWGWRWGPTVTLSGAASGSSITTANTVSTFTASNTNISNTASLAIE